MLHHYKVLAISTLVVSTVTLTGCIVDPGHNNNSYGSSSGNASDYDQGCADGKRGVYDSPRGSASQTYAKAWQSCHYSGQSNSGNNNGSDYDRGCSDAKVGSYDRSGNASQAYENGWQACRDHQGSAQSQGGVEAAKQACNSTFGGNGQVQTVTPVKPGVWEIILSDNYGRKVACTMGTEGTVLDWVEMKP